METFLTEIAGGCNGGTSYFVINGRKATVTRLK